MNSTTGRSAIRRLTTARLISISGAQAAQVSLLYSIHERTGSAAWVSAAFFASAGVAGLIGPLSGWIGDRFPRQRVMVVSELGAAFAYLCLGFAHDPLLLLALAVVAGAVNAPFRAASAAAVPNLVVAEELNWANGLIGSALNAGLVAGPLIGGSLVAALGPSHVFLLNAGALVLSASIVARIKSGFGRGRPIPGKAREGLKAIAAQPMLRSLIVASTLAWASFGIVLVADLPLARHFGAGPVGYGLLSSLWGGGAALSSWMVSRKLRTEFQRRGLTLGMLAMAISISAVTVLPSLPLVILASALGGVGSALFFVPWFSLMQRQTSEHVRSRVVGTAETFEHLGFALGMFLAGPLIAGLGVRMAYLIPAALLFTGAIAVSECRALGRLRPLRANAGVPEYASPY